MMKQVFDEETVKIEKYIKSIKMNIITDENLEIIGGFDVVEYEDGEIKYFDEFGEEIVSDEN